jgi:hypothetical protein
VLRLADPGLVRVRAGDFRGQHDLVALAGLLEPAADEALGGSSRFGARRDRIGVVWRKNRLVVTVYD